MGARPEFMPMDASFNKDVHKCMNRNFPSSWMAMRTISSKVDERLFSIATPVLASLAYCHIYDPLDGVVPSSKRILEDIDRVFIAMQIVLENKGVYVQGLTDGSLRPGRRENVEGRGQLSTHLLHIWGVPRRFIIQTKR